VKTKGGYSEELIEKFKETIDEADWNSYKDPELLTFMSTINKLEFDPRVQKLLGSIVEKMDAKGIQTPCFSGCDPECPFKEFE
jgi:hypothetical protein